MLAPIWKKIGMIGIHRKLDSDLQQKVRLTNLICIYGTLFSLCMGFLYVKIPSLFIIFIISAFIYSFSILFNYYSQYNAARFLLVAISPLYNILVAGLTTTESNTSSRFTFIIIIFFPVLVYQLSEKKKMFAGIAWLLFLYLITDKVNAWIPRLPEIRSDSEFDNSSVVFIRGILTMLLTFAGLYYLLSVHNETREKLEISVSNIRRTGSVLQVKSDELAAANLALEQKQLEIESMNRILQSQLLKAQLDPHFMYNALNSIQYFIIQNDAAAALGYLSKFSKLMRQVLENSVNETVSISDELKALTYYIDLEKMRCNNSFNYEIFTDDAIDTQNTEIPSMLLQPYIENAIVHGMRGKTEGGLIKLFLLMQGESILCVIEDNGTYQKLEDAGDHNPSKHKSRATAASINRMALLKSGAGIYTIILKDETGKPSGTRVEIKIPLSI